jgi:hypothetical protein
MMIPRRRQAASLVVIGGVIGGVTVTATEGAIGAATKGAIEAEIRATGAPVVAADRSVRQATWAPCRRRYNGRLRRALRAPAVLARCPLPPPCFR